MRQKPLIAVGCCFWEAEFLHGSKHGSGDKYIRAVSQYANVIPLLVPALTDCYGPKYFFVFFTNSFWGLFQNKYNIFLVSLFDENTVTCDLFWFFAKFFAVKKTLFPKFKSIWVVFLTENRQMTST